MTAQIVAMMTLAGIAFTAGILIERQVFYPKRVIIAQLRREQEQLRHQIQENDHRRGLRVAPVPESWYR